MFQKKTVTIGTIGAGYAAGLHASGFQRVCGLEIRLKTICDVRLDAAEKVKDRYRDSSVSPLYNGYSSAPSREACDLRKATDRIFRTERRTECR